MTEAHQASLLLAGGAILFAVLWFVAKALIGHLIAHWLLIKARKRGWGRQQKETKN